MTQEDAIELTMASLNVHAHKNDPGVRFEVKGAIEFEPGRWEIAINHWASNEQAHADEYIARVVDGEVEFL